MVTGRMWSFCGSLNPAMNLSPGIPVYIIKRNKPVFFIVDAVGRGGCGGGGGGAGSQQRSNKQFFSSWNLGDGDC